MNHYGWVLLEKAGFVAIKGFSIAVLARVLSPADFGLYAMVAVIVAVATLLAESGMAGSLIRKQEAGELDYSTVFTFNLVASLLLYAVIFVAAPWIAVFYGEDKLTGVLRLLALVLVLRSFCAVCLARLTRELRFKPQAYIGVVAALMSLALTYGLEVKGYGIWVLIAQQLMEAALFTVGLIVWARYRPGWRFSWELFRQHFGFGWRLMCSSFTDALAGKLPAIVVGKGLGVVPTGLYAQARKVNDVVLSVMTSTIDKAAFPLMVKQKANEEEFRRYALRLLAASSFFGFFVSAMISSAAGPLVVVFMLGEQWQGAAWILQILALSGFGMAIEVVTRNVLKTQGRAEVVLRLSLIKAAFAFVVLVPAASRGVEAVAWAVVACSLFNAVCGLVVLGRCLEGAWPACRLMILRLAVSASALMGLFCWWRPMVGNGPLATLVIMGMTGAIVYVSTACAVGVGEARFLVRNLLARVSRGRFLKSAN